MKTGLSIGPAKPLLPLVQDFAGRFLPTRKGYRRILDKMTYSSCAIFITVILISLYSDSTFAKGVFRKLGHPDVSFHQRIADPDLPIHNRASSYFKRFESTTTTNSYFLARDSGGSIYLVKSNGHIEKFESPGELIKRIQDMKSSINPPTIAMIELDYFYFKNELNNLSNGVHLPVILRNGEFALAKQFNSNGKLSVGLKLESGIIFDGDRSSSLAKARLVLDVDFDARDVQVLSLFARDDLMANRRISMAAKELHVDISTFTVERATKLVASMTQKIVVIVGHVEGTNFVVRHADGTASLRLPIIELERAAYEANSSLVLLGCNTSKVSSSTGFLSATTDIDVSSSISTALKSKDYGDFFANLAGNKAPLVLRAHTLDGPGRLVISRRKSDERENQLTALWVSTAIVTGKSPAEVAVLRSRLIFFLPNSVSNAFISGALLVLIRLQSLWRHWLKLWPLAPSRVHRSVVQEFIYCLRWILFIFIAPLVGVLLLPVVAISVLTFFLPFISWNTSIKLLEYSLIGKYDSNSTIEEPRSAVGGKFDNRWQSEPWTKKTNHR